MSKYLYKIKRFAGFNNLKTFINCLQSNFSNEDFTEISGGGPRPLRRPGGGGGGSMPTGLPIHHSTASPKENRIKCLTKCKKL